MNPADVSAPAQMGGHFGLLQAAGLHVLSHVAALPSLYLARL